jgi:fatty-acyl-CoA synthase
VLEAAVVARPDPMWGETPCAFVTLKPETNTAACCFGPLPKTSIRKIEKFVLGECAKENV